MATMKGVWKNPVRQNYLGTGITQLMDMIWPLLEQKEVSYMLLPELALNN
jgi:hypothetical protein